MAKKSSDAVKFNQHHVTNGTVKARCHYSVDNRTDGRKCVTIYASDYGHALGAIFQSGEYENDTDSMTDYFDKGRVRLFESHPLYAAARVRAALNAEKSRARYAARVYESRVRQYERRGMTRSDAQGCVDAEDLIAAQKVAA